VNLSVEAGTVTCLIGPNGAGKSTVLKTVSGLLRPKRGSVTFRGQEINRLSPKARLLLGIVHVPQDRSLFPAMSVWDNLLMGGYLIKDQKLLQERLDAAVQAFPICKDRSQEHAGSLSGGEQKQVELARTLVLDPTLMLLTSLPSAWTPRPGSWSSPASARCLRAVGPCCSWSRTRVQAWPRRMWVRFWSPVWSGSLPAAPASSRIPQVARLYLGGSPTPRTTPVTS
jgi:branched-chain amino acid transport system ATP-binding protein